jgi:hypothetical protein
MLMKSFQEVGMKFTEVLTECVVHPSWTVASTSLSFWYEFAISVEESLEPSSSSSTIEAITSIPKNTSRSEVEDRKQLTSNQPVFQALCRLVQAIHQRMSLRDEDEGEENGDSTVVIEEEEREFRIEAGNVLQQCLGLLGSSFLEIILHKMEEVLHNLSSTSHLLRGSLESSLFLLVSVAEVLPSQEPLFLPRILNLMMEQPAFRSIDATFTVFGSLASWLSNHSQLLYSTTTHILARLGPDSKVQSRYQAAIALRKICEQNAAILAPDVQLLAQNCTPALASMDVCPLLPVSFFSLRSFPLTLLRLPFGILVRHSRSCDNGIGLRSIQTGLSSSNQLCGVVVSSCYSKDTRLLRTTFRDNK